MTITFALLSEEKIPLNGSSGVIEKFCHINKDVFFSENHLYKDGASIWFYEEDLDHAGYEVDRLNFLSAKHLLKFNFCIIVDVNYENDALAVFFRFFEYVGNKFKAVIDVGDETYGPESSAALVERGFI